MNVPLGLARISTNYIMKKTFLLLALLLGFHQGISAQNSSYDSFLKDYDQFLSENLEAGLLDYDAIRAKPEKLNSLVQFLSSAMSKEYSGNTRKSLLINAYNVFVIKRVVEKMPINSPLDVDGFFTKPSFQFFGKELSLDTLEKKFLFKEFPDPRLHFVLVCAAIGCPPLIPKAYRPVTLDSQIEKSTKNAVNSKSLVSPNSDGSSVDLSELFSWYQKDFGKDNKAMLGFINKYHSTEITGQSQINFKKYNWSLNTK